MSRVATRPAPSSSTARSRPGPPYGQAAPGNRAAPSSSSTSSYPSRRYQGQSDFYRVDEVVRNGVRSEIIVIEDTPPPGAGPSGSTSYNSSSRYDSHSNHYEPAAKKRRNDGGYTSDQYRAPPPSSSHYPPPYASTNGYKSTASTTSRNKRKLDDGGYSDGRDGGSARAVYNKSKEEPPPIKDKEGHFIVRVGGMLGGPREPCRFRITKLLGQGTFGKVVCCRDTASHADVAVKVIRAVAKYKEASKVEVKVLRHIAAADPMNKYKCIHLLQEFEFYGHVCLVTELLSASVFDFLKENQYQEFPFSHIQSFAKQLLESVAFLHRNNLIHTDLKPENILLEKNSFTEGVGRSKKPKRILDDTAIRLIDFGSATFEHEYHATVVSTRHYRAPEIIIGTGWSYPCDAWSIGCILIEFYTGEALFQTHENLEHLAMMEKVFGTIPERLIDQVFENKQNQHQEFFKETQKGNQPRRRSLNFPLPSTSKQSTKFVRAMRTLDDTIRGNTVSQTRFKDLLRGLLRWDPALRSTPKEALQHDFFTLNLKDEGSHSIIY